MFFKKRRKLNSPMEQFLHRDELGVDERMILDVYMTGVAHALTGVNAVHDANGKTPIYQKDGQHPSLEAKEVEKLVAEFLKERPDMKRFALGLVAVQAVLQRYKA